MKMKPFFAAIFILWNLITAIGCGRIGFESVSLDTESVDTESIDTESVDTESVDTESIDTVSVDTVSIDTESIDTVSVDTVSVDTESVDTETIDTETIDTVSVDTETIDTEIIDTESVDTETVDTETVDTETDTGIDTACPPIPDGTDLLSDTDIPDYTSYGPAAISLDSVSDASDFTEAWHVESGTDNANSTASQLQHVINGDITAGDHIVVEFWTRCVSAATGTCQTGMLMEESVDPWPRAAEYYPVVTFSWDFHQVPFVAALSFPAGNSQITFRQGYNDQIIEIYPSRIVNFGPLESESRVECIDNTTALLTEVSFVEGTPTPAVVDFEYNYWIEVNALPAATVTASPPGLPDWLTLDETRNLIYGTPSYAELGTTSPITLQAQNATGSDTVQLQFTVIVDTALLGHWPLDEASGTVAADISGNGSDGTVYGDLLWQPSGGHINGALQCDGATGTLDYVELPSTAELNNVQNSAYTLSAWVRPNSIPAGVDPTDNDYGYGIVLKADPLTGLFYNSAQEFVTVHQFDALTKEAAFGPYPPGVFYHVVAVHDPVFGAQVLYINGESVAASYYLEETTLGYGTAPWRIGIGDPAASTSRYEADMDIDDVRIYSRALDRWEIGNLAGI